MRRGKARHDGSVDSINLEDRTERITIKHAVCVCLFVLLNATVSHPAEFSRPVTIRSIYPLAEGRPTEPGRKNIIRVYVNQEPWGASTCRNDAADLLPSEKNLLSILLTAIALGKPVHIYVDDTMRPYDTVCQVTALWVIN
jgi:hypothetical protein